MTAFNMERMHNSSYSLGFAEAAFEENHALALLGEIGDQGTIVVIGKDLGPDRHLDDEVGAARPGAVGTRAAFAARGTEMLRAWLATERSRTCSSRP